MQHDVNVSKGRLVLISGLALISLVLSSYGFYLTYRQIPIPTIVQWGVANKHCTVVVDTAPIKNLADNYYIALACGIIDNTIDLTEDKRIVLSGPFNIYGGAQAISAASNPEFDKFVESFGSTTVLSFWQRVFLIPREREVSEVHKLSDVPRLKGKLY
jgi:hypothetical protein